MPGPRPTPAYDRVMRRSIASILYSHDGESCINCTLSTNGDGYPVVSAGDGSQTTAARVVWEHSKGPIQAPMVVCHRCNNRACVNVRHMFLGSHSERAAMKVGMGRARGNSKLSTAQVKQIVHRTAHGERSVDLAREYGVTARAIANIKNRRSWKSLARQLQ